MKNFCLFQIVLFSIVVFPGMVLSGVIFSDNFDSSPDWQSNQTVNKSAGGNDISVIGSEGNVPKGWHGYRAASSVFTNNRGHDTFVLDSSGAMGDGKGITYAIESSGPDLGRWAGGSLDLWLGKDGYNEIYIRFYLKYHPDWDWGGPTNTNKHAYQKLLRISSYPDIEDYNSKYHPHYYGGSGFNMPVWFPDFYYNYQNPPYGFTFLNEQVRQAPDYGMDIGTVQPNALWPTDGDWHCYELHVKMNSAEGVADGIRAMYIDGLKVFEKTDTVWKKAGSHSRGWNWLMFLDNATVNGRNISENHEQLVYFDNVVVSTEYIGPIGGPPKLPGVPTNVRLVQ